MNKITEQLLKAVSDWKGNFKEPTISGRTEAAPEDSPQNTLKIENKPDGPGLIIRISPEAQQETVIFRPASPGAMSAIWSTMIFTWARERT